MHITVEPCNDYAILHLRGEFDTYYCPQLQEEVDALIKAGVCRAVLNLRLVKFINSTALGAIIKASKALTGAGGKLVIARPSPFCRDIIEKVGLDRVVTVYDTDEEACANLASDAPAAISAEEITEDPSSVLFSLADAERTAHFIEASAKANPVHGHSFGKNWSGVGRMAALDTSGLAFTWNGGNTGLSPFDMGQMLALGTELKLKFRLPLFQKGYCEALCRVEDLEERADGVRVGLRFSEIDDETVTAVGQYAKDMAFLRDELRKATEN
ncbi:MAG: anti-sigma factor antagonist [Planctomycetota bacterium]|jgi:anti-anti-sigma factor|nr:anti-sigma factor antagonist [Planctomycetota bacterium]